MLKDTDHAPNTLIFVLSLFNKANKSEKVLEHVCCGGQFMQLTNISFYRVLLSAGSGYLERILDQNPSDHPTIVLSHIKFNELKHLVEFMYSGEIRF